jgi:hypothetical protein
MAWHYVAALWYRYHGERAAATLCAGCDKPLSGAAEALLLPHGEAAHVGGGLLCIAAYGRRWKRDAASALARMGIPTPANVIVETESGTQSTERTQSPAHGRWEARGG